MPIVVNSNASATAASNNLSKANNALRASLERLSSGRRINSSRDDAGGMSVAYKLESRTTRTHATIQNAQNGLSFLQVQDGAMESIAKIANRMSELRVMADDVIKNSSDIENGWNGTYGVHIKPGFVFESGEGHELKGIDVQSVDVGGVKMDLKHHQSLLLNQK